MKRTLFVRGVSQGRSGYADTTRNLLRALVAEGVDVGYADALHDFTDSCMESLPPLRREPIPGEPSLGLYSIQQFATLASLNPCSAYYTAFEAFPLPPAYQEHLAKAKVIVPSGYCSTIFPGTIVPHGIDPAYRPRDAKSGVFTFVAVGTWETRKGWDVLIPAFAKEFKQHEARLVIRARGPAEAVAREARSLGAGKNVTFDTAPRTHSKLAELYNQADCFTLATRAEGYCKPAADALACGIPSVMPRSGGHVDYAVGRLTKVIHVPVPSSAGLWPGAKWCESDIMDFRAGLRYAVDNREEMRKAALAAAPRMAERTWTRCARDILEVLKP